MKKSILTLTIILIAISAIFAQSPQSFKYQAVIRDSGGEIIANQTVGLQVSILQGSETGTPVYVEEWNIATNQYGLVNLNIGEGISSDDFSAISWGTNNYFVKIALDESGGTTYTDMGTSQLLSVPYALYANQTGGSISSPWVTGTTGITYSEGNVGISTENLGLDETEPLFEVRNNIGEIVFAVYNEGIRMNVDNASSDHDRGGFAIGGLNMNKGVLNYFQVTPDSVRIYLDETASPTDRGGFAIGGQNMNKQITSEYMFVNTDSTRITTAADGGFGVASKTLGKGHGVNYLNITTENMFIGEDAGKNNDLGVHNSFFGYNTGYSNTDGSFNVFIGQESGYSNFGGHNNVFVGQKSGYNNLSGASNVFLGQSSGESNKNGTNNVFLGYQSGYLNDAGNHSVFIGNQAGYNETSSNKLYIENSDKNYQNALIYGDFQEDKIRLNGNTGIDIDDEGYKLNVNGNLNFNGVLYKNGQPFNPGLIKAQLSDDLGSPSPYTAPEEGFLIFNDGADQPHGFYYWEGNEWLKILTSSGADITTNTVGGIGLNSADLSGDINDDGGSPISIVGFCWDTQENPDLSKPHNAEAYSTDNFSTSISGLTAYETYFVRAYAINDAGTKYGNQVSFTTSVADNITVTSPSAGNVLYSEYTYDIEWTDNIAPDVAIELWKGAAKISDIDISTPSDGSHTWTLANNLTAGTDYKIKVINTGNTSLFDFSDNFEIRVPLFTITNPATSGTILTEWIAGNTQNINWTSNLLENFKIELWRNGAKVNTITASIAASTGTLEYNVPLDIDIFSDYELRFTSFIDENIVFVSDQFRILGNLADADGNNYYSVRIGDQLWMRQNLKTTSDANGMAIPNVTDNTAWANLGDNDTDKAYSWYSNDANNANIYGALYTYSAATNACPFGWHLPNDADWTELTDGLGGLSVAGGKLKERGTVHWIEPNTGATDENGFAGYGTGYRDYINEGTSFFYKKELGFWWSSTDLGGTDASKRTLYNNNTTVNTDGNRKSNGFSVRCLADENTATGISTDAVGSIASNGATLYATLNPNNTTAKLTFEYGETTAYGNETSAKFVSGETSQQAFVVIESGLTPTTIYHYRAKVENADGTIQYGDDMSFTTIATMSDIDGNVYNTVKIGTQTWMKENLAVTHRNDGTEIDPSNPAPAVYTNAAWGDLPDDNSAAAYCFYNNDINSEYGALYTYAASTDVCPDGWHLPSQTEAEYLITTILGGTVRAGGKMKATGFNFWNSPNTGATNESGFTAYGAGYRHYISGEYVQQGGYFMMWTSTTPNPSAAAYFWLFQNSNEAYTDANTKSTGNSVRCIKD